MGEIARFEIYDCITGGDFTFLYFLCHYPHLYLYFLCLHKKFESKYRLESVILRIWLCNTLASLYILLVRYNLTNINTFIKIKVCKCKVVKIHK